ncbi:hypothetical protein V2G26_013586 [Clonostachys chloroleuca]
MTAIVDALIPTGWLPTNPGHLSFKTDMLPKNVCILANMQSRAVPESSWTCSPVLMKIMDREIIQQLVREGFSKS